jgi:DNA ligase (NAD+)
MWPCSLSNYAGLDDGFKKSVESVKAISKKREPTDPLYCPLVQKDELEAMISKLHELLPLFLTGGENVDIFDYDILRLKAKHLNLVLKSNVKIPRSPSSNFNNDIWETFSLKELLSEIQRREKSVGNINSDIAVLPAVNGVNISLFYSGGVMISGIVHELDDAPEGFLNLLRWLKGIPKVISDKREITVRGTLTIKKSDFSRINRERVMNGECYWFSPRSALLSAFAKSDDPYKELESKVQCIFYGFSLTSPPNVHALGAQKREVDGGYWTKSSPELLREQPVTHELPTVSKMQQHLATMGFAVFSQRNILVESFSRVIHELPSFVQSQANRNQQFITDGIVVRYDSFSEQSIVGSQGLLLKRFPHLEKAKVKDVDYSILPSGQIAANVFFDTVHLMGSEVNKVVVHTQEELTRLGIRKDDEIVVYIKSDMTSGILFSHKNGSGPFAKLPETCPRCDASPKRAKWGTNSEAVFCSAHFICVDDTPERLMRLGSTHGLNIPSLTMEMVNELIRRNLVSNVSDIFYLSESDADSIDKAYKETYMRLLEEIKLSQKTTLDRFIFGMLTCKHQNGTRSNLSFAAAQELSHRFGTLLNLTKASLSDFTAMSYVDKMLAKSVVSFFTDPKNIEEMKRCLSGGVIINEPRKEIVDLSFKQAKGFSKEQYRALIDKIVECEKDHGISDLEFDLLDIKANDVEVIHPEWKLPHAERLAEKRSVIWSDRIKLDKTYSIDEMRKLLAKRSTPYVAEPKVNGIACTLFYKNGLLQQAITRHSGKTGLDFTHRLTSAKNIPQKLRGKVDAVIRGELFLPLLAFKNINDQRSASAEKSLYKDPMSALLHVVNGKSRDSVMNESICFFPYHVSESNSLGKETQHITREALYGHLASIGFSFQGIMGDRPFYRVFEKPGDLVLWLSDVGARRMEYPFDIDGIVIKSHHFNRTGTEQSLAYKFSIENRTTTVKKLRFNICSNGFVRALLDVKPVKFSNGRTVSSIALPDIRKVKTLHEGTSVVVKYTGGAYPSLESIVEDNETHGPKITVPTDCPHCEQTLEQTPGGSLRCINKFCHRQHSSSLEIFATKVGLGPSNVVKEIIDSGVVSSPFDFYTLMPEDLQVSVGFSQQKINDFMVSLSLSKKTSFSAFLRALKLEALERLPQPVSSFRDLLSLGEERLASLKPGVAEEILSFTEENKSHFKQLMEMGMCSDNFTDSAEITRKYDAYTARMKQISAISTDLFQLLNINERETRVDIASVEGYYKSFVAEWKREQISLAGEEKKLAKALSQYLEHTKSKKSRARTELSMLTSNENENNLWE